MKPIEYFEKNKEKIYKTAEFVANRRNASVESIMCSIEKEFVETKGTCHLEQITIDSNIITITKYLAELRKLEFERINVFLIKDNELIKIYQSDGDQFSSVFDDYGIIAAVLKASLIYPVSNKTLSILICHNHPFAYKAFPSDGDILSFQGLSQTIKSFNLGSKGFCIEIVDFSIVTLFDYFSFAQC